MALWVARGGRYDFDDAAISPGRRENFGVNKQALVTGWSMGALQAFHWGALYPGMVERIAPFCGSARCSRHNFVFLEGVKAARDWRRQQ